MLRGRESTDRPGERQWSFAAGRHPDMPKAAGFEGCGSEGQGLSPEENGEVGEVDRLGSSRNREPRGDLMSVYRDLIRDSTQGDDLKSF